MLDLTSPGSISPQMHGCFSQDKDDKINVDYCNSYQCTTSQQSAGGVEVVLLTGDAKRCGHEVVPRIHLRSSLQQHLNQLGNLQEGSHKVEWTAVSGGKNGEH